MNYRYFCNFLLSSSLLALITLIGDIVAASLRWETYKSEPGLFIAYNVPTFYVGITSLFFFLSTFSFWCYQFRLTARGANAVRDVIWRREWSEELQKKYVLVFSGESERIPVMKSCRKKNSTVEIWFIHGVHQFDHRKWSNCSLVQHWIECDRFSIDWSEPYESDFYVKQETIYRKNRIELSSNSLAIPKRCIRRHIEILEKDNHSGVKNEIEEFRKTNPSKSSRNVWRKFHPIELNTCFRKSTSGKSCRLEWWSTNA